MRVQVTLRESDTKLREHFEPIPKGDQSHEARRLMLIGLEYEKAQKSLLVSPLSAIQQETEEKSN